MKEKPFILGQVLSITADRLLCDIGEVYEILNHITGNNLFTHVLPRAMRFAKPLVLELHPELALAASESEYERLGSLIKESIAIYGDNQSARKLAICDFLNALPLPKILDIPTWEDRWLSYDPVKELESMIGKEKVMVAQP